jgi:hypothetical protein
LSYIGSLSTTNSSILVQHRGRRRLLEARLDLRPQPRQELHVGGEFRLALALGVRPEDEAAGRQRQRAEGRPQAVALALVADTPGDADVTRLRHVHDVAAGQRDERGDPCALGAERLLRDLHEDVLAPRQHVLDGAGRLAARRLAALVHVDVGVVLGGGQHGAGVVAEVRGVVARVEEGVLRQPDVHERRLHAGQDVRDRALVHRADDRAVTMPLEVEIGEEVTFLDGDAGLEHTRVHDDAFAHGSTSSTRRRPGGDRPRVSLELPHPH